MTDFFLFEVDVRAISSTAFVNETDDKFVRLIHHGWIINCHQSLLLVTNLASAILCTLVSMYSGSGTLKEYFCAKYPWEVPDDHHAFMQGYHWYCLYDRV